MTDERIIYLQLGDGDILAVAADGATVRPIVADERLGGNQTTSLCQPEAWREFRVAETAAGAGPVLVLLSTDGYVNSFRSQEDFMQIGHDYLQILREQGAEVLADELPNILAEATQQGSGDDITLGMLHVEVLPPVPVVANGASAASKAQVSKSVMIRELTRERSTQQQKLTELETDYAGAKKHVMQLRLGIGAVALVAIALLSQQYWRPLFQGKPVNPPVVEQPKHPVKSGPDVKGGGPPTPPVNAGPGDKTSGGANANMECVLTFGNGELVVADKQSVSTTDLALNDKKQLYAQVKLLSGTLFLKNLSDDKWTVTSPNSGKKSQIKKNENAPLLAGTSIEFHHGASASVSYRSKPPKDDAGTVTTVTMNE